MTETKKKILVVSHEPIQPNMAGPPIRMLEIARALGAEFPTTLAVPGGMELENEPFQFAQYNPAILKQLCLSHDVVILAGFLLPCYPFLKNMSAALVLDIYDPVIFEYLELNLGQKPEKQKEIFDELIDSFALQMSWGDFFICADDFQRAMWVGMLISGNRINPLTFSEDRTLRSLIDLVPFGLPSQEPEKRKNVLKGAYPGIEKDDFVVLWGGGIYDWLDPLTAVRAMDLVSRKNPKVKLFFMGCKYPNPVVVMSSIAQTINLSDSLELSGKSVFFNDWVPYAERADYLLEADIGLNTHPRSIETDFAYRSRILDYIWAELPILTTRGGALSDIVAEKQFGLTVDYGDPEDLADKILKMADGEIPLNAFKENIRKHRYEFSWAEAVEPLKGFCREAKKRLDKAFLIEKISVAHPAYFLKRFRAVLAEKGGAYLVRHSAIFLLRRCFLAARDTRKLLESNLTLIQLHEGSLSGGKTILKKIICRLMNLTIRVFHKIERTFGIWAYHLTPPSER